MSKDRNKYARKYSRALTSVPTVEQGELLIKDKFGKLKKIHPLDVKIDGSSFGLIKDLYETEKTNHIKLLDSLNESIARLTSVLIDGGYETSNVELNALIDDINHLLIIKPQHSYYNFTIDEQGYVTGMSPIGVVTTSHTDVPSDFDKGYWKIENGNFVLDQEKYNQTWGVL